MDDIGYQRWKQQYVLLRRPDFLYRKKSTIKKRFKSSKMKMPIRRLAVKYAHGCVSRQLHRAKIPHLKRTHGNDVVRIICRTRIQLQHLNAVFKEIIQHKYIEEIGMPLHWAYKMKQLVVFIKPFDAKCSKKIEDKFKNCGLNFHITVFDVKNPYAKDENTSKIPDDESKTKNLKAKPVTKIEKVKPITGASCDTKKDIYLFLELVIKIFVFPILLVFAMQSLLELQLTD
jgi:hypothetical protein